MKDHLYVSVSDDAIQEIHSWHDAGVAFDQVGQLVAQLS